MEVLERIEEEIDTILPREEKIGTILPRNDFPSDEELRQTAFYLSLEQLKRILPTEFLEREIIIDRKEFFLTIRDFVYGFDASKIFQRRPWQETTQIFLFIMSVLK